jgi:hypothetical protein
VCNYITGVGADVNISMVKKHLLEEEHRKAALAGADASLMEVTATSLIINGLEIEDMQYVSYIRVSLKILIQTQYRRSINALVKSKSSTVMQAAEIQSKRTTLLKSIQKFCSFQPVYMPGLISHLNSQRWKEKEDALLKPETMLLWLPSSIKDPASRSAICPQSFHDLEERLRYAQLVEALVNVRRQLRQRVYVGRLKTRNGNGQAYWLRSNTFQAQVEARIWMHRAQYDAARDALLTLRGPGEWSEIYQELKTEDLRGITQKAMTQDEFEELKRTCLMVGLSEEAVAGELNTDMGSEVNPHHTLGEGTRVLSWIW